MAGPMLLLTKMNNQKHNLEYLQAKKLTRRPWGLLYLDIILYHKPWALPASLTFNVK